MGKINEYRKTPAFVCLIDKNTYFAHRSIPSLSSSLRTRFRLGRIAGALSCSSFIVCRSGLVAFRLTYVVCVIFTRPKKKFEAKTMTLIFHLSLGLVCLSNLCTKLPLSLFSSSSFRIVANHSNLVFPVAHEMSDVAHPPLQPPHESVPSVLL